MWICKDCGCKYGTPRDGVSTFHIDHCDWCGNPEVAVTESRDYGYPLTYDELWLANKQLKNQFVNQILKDPEGSPGP